MVFDSAVTQLRYAAGILRGRMNPAMLSRIADDVVATVAEFGAPGEDSALLPGQGAAADPEAAAAMLVRNLRRTAAYATAHTAYYQQVLAASGIDASSLDPQTWARVPVTPKAALRGMPSMFVSSRSAPVVLATTTGTTGTPTRVWFSAGEVDALVAINTLALCITEKLRPEHVMAHTSSSRGTMALLSVNEAVRRIGAGFLQIGTIEPALALERLAAPLDLPRKAAQPTHLNGAASYLAALVEAAEQGGWQAADFGLLSVQSGGEILTEALTERIREVFGVERISSNYMATEIAPVGAGRCSQGHLHFPSEFGHVELLDPVTLQPAEPGGLATVVATPFSFFRECTVLLRYVTADLVRLPVEAPTCEMAGITASSDILGRYDGPVSLAAPARSVLEVLEGDRGVPLPARYCLVDTAAGPLLHVVVRHNNAAALSRLEERAARLAPRLAGIVLHDDAEDLPSVVPVRADLRERSFERGGRHTEPIGVGV